MRKNMPIRNLISAIIVTALLIHFMTTSPSPKIIFIPFLICSISMIGKSIAQLLQKKKAELVFGKLYVLGFLLFLIGFLVVAVYMAIRDNNYSMLLFSVPFWLVGIYLIKKRILRKEGKKNGGSAFIFAVVVSALLVMIAFLAGIYLLITGIKGENTGMVFGGVFFTLGSFTFVVAALTVQGWFDKIKIDVMGLYIGVVFVVIGVGIILLKSVQSQSLMEAIREFKLWIFIPLMMIVVGVMQIVKSLKYRK